jgi:hypothetical protein
MGFGIGWYPLRRKAFEAEKIKNTPIKGDPNLERLGVYLGLLMGLGLSLRNALKGWFNIYMGDEEYWSRTLWHSIDSINRPVSNRELV